MAFDSPRSADGGTVKLNVDTSELSKLETAEREWRESVGQMSREALKLDLAQDRLKGSLQRYGAESAQAKRATIALKDAEEGAARAADRQTRETQQLTAVQARQRAGASSLTRSVVGLAGAYVGAYGLLSATRSVLAAAKEEELVHGQTKVALEGLGLSYERHVDTIERVIRATSRLGFDDEELLKSFQLLVRGSGDVDEALERVALAAGVARGRYRDLEFGTQVVNKAQLGMIGTIRRLGIDIDKNANSTEALAALQRLYGRSAQEAAKTGVAAQDRLNVAWENAEEIVGRGLLPTVIRYSERIEAWLSDADNMRELQERVNEAIETGEAIVEGFSDALHAVRTVTGPVIEGLGGLERVVEAVLILGILRKSQVALGGLRSLAGGFGLVGASAVTAGATSSAALTGIGASATAATGKVAGLRAGLAGLAGLGPIAISLALTMPDQIPSQGGKPGTITTVDDFDGLLRMAREGRLPVKTIDRLEDTGSITPQQANRLRAAIPGAETPRRSRGGSPRRPGSQFEETPAGAKSGRRRPTLVDLELALAREEARGGDTTDELRALLGFFERQIRALEARKSLTAEQKEKLRGLYGEVASVQSQLDSLEEAEEQKLRDQRERAQDRRRRQREAAERAADAAARGAVAGASMWTGRFGAGSGAAAGAGRGARGRGGQTAVGGSGLTQDDVRRELHELLTGLHGVVSGFGSNFAPDSGSIGQIATHSFAQTELLRETTRTLGRLAGGMWHPGGRYAGAELAAAGLGPGF